MRARKRIRPGDGDPRHGTYNGYVNPRNWHQTKRRLCLKCRVTLGFQPVEYGTSYVEAKRPW